MKQIMTTKDDLIDADRYILSSMFEDEYESIPTAYNELCATENPDFFKTKGNLFDVIVLPPTKTEGKWSISVVATRKGLHAIKVACNADGTVSHRIRGMSEYSERMFLGESPTTLEAETGFLQRLLHCSRLERKYGVALKESKYPYSQEMMEYVLDDILYILNRISKTYRQELTYNIGVFMAYTMGGDSPYD